MLSAIRRLCLRGNALYICIPRGMAAQLGWQVGGTLTVEQIGPNSLRVRPSDAADLSSAHIPPMTFGVPRTAGK